MKQPNMTRRHFEFIAAVIRAMPDHAMSLRAQRESCAAAFRDALDRTCAGFDRDQFIREALEDKRNGK